MFDDTEQLFDGLIDLIEKWKPKVFPNEKKYQKDLYNYLIDLKDAGTIKRERLIRTEGGANKVDIIVDKVGIELKKDLKTRPSIDRAVAQIKRMLREFNFLIVVLVGDNNRQSIDLLKHEIRDFVKQDSLIGDNNAIKLIEVGKKGKVTRQAEPRSLDMDWIMKS